MKILITGGTGFIGKHLVKRLTSDEHQVTVLTRSKRTSKNRFLSYREWDGKSMPPAIGLYDVVINLAGASIAEGKWTPQRKQLIMDSRQEATEACVNYINQSPNPPKVFISASGVGYYGATAQGEVNEQSPVGDDFPAKVCEEWEQAARKANCRNVQLRIAVVLGKEGGALEKMVPIYRMCLGGRFASGKQGFPWIHIDDIIKIIYLSIENESIKGPINASAPQIVDQATFSDTLGTVVGRPDLFIVPKFGLKLLFGEQALLFWGGQKVVPQKLLDVGFEFLYPELEEALEISII